MKTMLLILGIAVNALGGQTDEEIWNEIDRLHRMFLREEAMTMALWPEVGTWKVLFGPMENWPKDYHYRFTKNKTRNAIWALYRDMHERCGWSSPTFEEKDRLDATDQKIRNIRFRSKNENETEEERETLEQEALEKSDRLQRGVLEIKARDWATQFWVSDHLKESEPDLLDIEWMRREGHVPGDVPDDNIKQETNRLLLEKIEHYFERARPFMISASLANEIRANKEKITALVKKVSYLPPPEWYEEELAENNKKNGSNEELAGAPGTKSEESKSGAKSRAGSKKKELKPMQPPPLPGKTKTETDAVFENKNSRKSRTGPYLDD